MRAVLYMYIDGSSSFRCYVPNRYVVNWHGKTSIDQLTSLESK